MSLLRTIALRAPRQQVRFSTSQFQRKDSGSVVKETVDKVNRTVSDAALKGIEKGEQASETIKETVGIKAKEAEGTAKEMTGEAKGSAKEVTGEAKGSAKKVTGEAKGMTAEARAKAAELASETKGKTHEIAGQAKGKTHEMAGQAKGKVEEVKSKI